MLAGYLVLHMSIKFRFEIISEQQRAESSFPGGAVGKIKKAQEFFLPDHPDVYSTPVRLKTGRKLLLAARKCCRIPLVPLPGEFSEL